MAEQNFHGQNDQNSQNNQNENNEPIRFEEWGDQNPYQNPDNQNNEAQKDEPGSESGSRFANPYADGRYSEQFTTKTETEISLIDERKEKASFSRIGFGYAVLSVVTLAVSLLLQVIVMKVNTEFYNSILFRNLVTPISIYLFALPFLLIIISGNEAKAPEKKQMSFGKFLLFLIVCFGVMYIGANVGNTVMDVLSVVVGHDYSNSLESIIDYDKLWISAIFTVIVAPIGEEFVFRKLIIDRTQKYGGFISIFLSALMFGLMHANLYQFFYCFGLGLILGYIYYSTGKLHITMIIHAIINLVGGVLTSLLSPYIDSLATMEDPSAIMEFVIKNPIPLLIISLFSTFVYAAMICAVVLPIVLRKRIVLGRGEVVIPRGKRISIVVANAGIIVMFVVYALEFILNLLPY